MHFYLIVSLTMELTEENVIKVLEELMHYGENDSVRADAAKFIVDKQYDKEKSKATMEFSQFTERLQRAQDRIKELHVVEG